MKKLIKKGTSLLMTAILGLSSLLGMSVEPVLAAGEQVEAYMVSYPMDGDAVSGADWGHSAKNFMNGWGSFRSQTLTLHSLSSYKGMIAYCIEPGVSQHVGDILTNRGEDFWENYPSEYNRTITPDEIKLFIGRIMQYGYVGNISDEWVTQNNLDSMAHAYATQLLIWETVVGERDNQFHKVDTGGADTVFSLLSEGNPLRAKAMEYYQSIEASVKNHLILPSFLTGEQANAQTVELTWNGSQYQAVLTDTNHVLGNFSFSSDRSLNFSVSGDQLTISAKEAPAGEASITATRNNSRRGVVVWTDGSVGPDGGAQDVVTYGDTIGDQLQGFLKVTVSYGSAKIVKTSEDGKVGGLRFTITGNGVNQTVTTESNGEIQIDNLAPGTYTVTEQPLDLYETPKSQTVTVVSGQTATVTFDNVLKRGSLKVTKTSEDGLEEGITFHLSGTSDSGQPVDAYAVTDSSGVARFEDVLIGSGYVLEEVDTSNRYVVPGSQNVAIEWNKVTERSFNNILKKFRVTVTKVDQETGEPQGDASLAGALYGLYQNGTLVDQFVTDENGQFTTGYYPCGTGWSLQEIKASEGYLLDETVYTVGTEPELYTVERNNVALKVTERVVKGRIAITKHADNGETGIDSPEEGAEFQIYRKAAGSFEGAKESERDTLVCDAYGFAQSKDLPYGIYVVHQTKGWEGRELIKDFDVYISRNQETYRYLLNNAVFESHIKVVKVDAETGNPISYAGAGFQIYRPDGSKVEMTVTYPESTAIDTFYTNAEGYLVTPEKLEYGTGYSLVEVQAPYGYVLDSTPVYFDITQDATSEEGAVTVVEVTKSDISQKGIIHITKTGEVFASVMESEDNLYQPVYEVQGLPGAVFEITALEDIYTLDGTLRYSAGEVVDTITTGEDGTAQSQPLYLGKFQVKEIQYPHGMVDTGENVTNVELVYAGQEVEITETSAGFYNQRQKVQVSLSKVLEQDETFGIGMNGEISAVTFGLYAKEDITAADGSVIPADGLLEILSVNETGQATSATDLPFGSYYLQEISTDVHYLLNGERFPFTFEYGGASTAVVEIDANQGEPIANELIRGGLWGRKTDEDGVGLSGALIGLFRPEETEFVEETALVLTTSSEDGSFSFDGIPYGTWILKELESPEGYLLSEETILVTIGTKDQTVEVSLVNEQIRGNITLTKVDADYPENKLSGAVFEVYADANGNGTLEEEDVQIGTLTEKEIGVYEMADLPYGKYLIRETQAPEAFLVDTGVYPVFIEEDGKTYAVENEAGVGFINQPMEGQLKIVKTSSDGVVEGFSFQITGPNGYSVTMKTNENGEIFLDDLRIGEYTVSEILDEASESYIIPEDTLASVQENMMTVVKMHNKQIQGRITLTKVDADYPENKLSGAVFEVYADANGNGTLEEEDVLVGALTEKETGVYEMTDLPYGSYLVKETQAPEGFLLDTGLYPVRIQEDGETVTVENQAGIGFINQPMEGQLKIVKTSSDGIVEGFSFQVTGPNGYSVTVKTNENGEIFLEGLRIGEYIISEISDDASASYILPEDKLASVQENSVTIVEMHNEKQPQDVPKTGDQTNLIFWILLLGTAAAGAGICLAAYYGKHDARDD